MNKKIEELFYKDDNESTVWQILDDIDLVETDIQECNDALNKNKDKYEKQLIKTQKDFSKIDYLPETHQLIQLPDGTITLSDDAKKDFTDFQKLAYRDYELDMLCYCTNGAIKDNLKKIIDNANAKIAECCFIKEGNCYRRIDNYNELLRINHQYGKRQIQTDMLAVDKCTSNIIMLLENYNKKTKFFEKCKEFKSVDAAMQYITKNLTHKQRNTHTLIVKDERMKKYENNFTEIKNNCHENKIEYDTIKSISILKPILNYENIENEDLKNKNLLNTKSRKPSQMPVKTIVTGKTNELTR